MEFEDHDEEMEMTTSYDTNNNNTNNSEATPPSRVKTSPTRPRYRECLKNHAVTLGGHALDGCGEFLPAGPEGSIDALQCAACHCHRNFHRREADLRGLPYNIIPYNPHFNSHYRPPAGFLQVRPLALPSTSGGEEELSELAVPGSGVQFGGKKRFRTKFTAEQKERMLALAERLGWRIQKQDEPLVQEFCSEAGVRRHVLKVWMHNNKHTLGKKP